MIRRIDDAYLKKISERLSKDFGYSGQGIHKQHYTGSESCLHNYQLVNINDDVIQVRQFSNFFGFRVKGITKTYYEFI